jgi:hypothetical protein
MKNVFFLLLLLIFHVHLNAQVSKTEKLLTTRSWVVEKDNGKFLNDYELRKISFVKDGSLSLIRFENGEKTSGKWRLDKDDKTVIINLDKIEEEPSLIFEISSIDQKAMTLLKDGEISEAVNVPNNYKLPKKERSKKLVGAWLISKRNGENVEHLNEMIQFNADGTAISNNHTEIAKWATRKNVLTFNSGLIETLGFEVSKDNKKLTLNARGLIIELTKTNQVVTPMKMEEKDAPIEDVNTDIKNSKVFEKSEIIGNWNIKNIDSENVQERKLVLKLNTEGTFSVFENEKEDRKGKWELVGNMLKLTDVDNQITNYTTFQLENGDLKLTDYYLKLILEKIPD